MCPITKSKVEKKIYKETNASDAAEQQRQRMMSKQTERRDGIISK